MLHHWYWLDWSEDWSEEEEGEVAGESVVGLSGAVLPRLVFLCFMGVGTWDCVVVQGSGC